MAQVCSLKLLAGLSRTASSRLDWDTAADPVSQRANREGRWSELREEEKEQQDSLVGF